MDNKHILTTEHGKPIENDQHSITTGQKVGYAVMNDSYLMEKLSHFNRERIPERVVHAKGAGAYGYFEVTHDVSKYTCAKFLSEVGKKTEAFIRFSTVGGESGSADTERDPRGFALKLYTEEGNYDIVGNNTPVFFIRDAIKFPDFVHTQKRNPQTNLKDANMFWDFLSLTPESTHQVTFLFSDRGTPYSYRHMDGFGANTWMFYNNEGEHYWFKWHFKSDQGNKTLTASEASELAGKSPDHATKDLFNSIEEGNFPSWTAYLQIMTPEQAKEYRFDPFDVTKVWFHSDSPLIPVGKLVLDRNPQNYFAEVEQAAFAPSVNIPGIYPSPDKLLQGRLFAYADAQRYRLGKNHAQIPVNSPKATCPYSNSRGGGMVVNANYGATANYYPNSVNEYAEAKHVNGTPEVALEEAKLARHKITINDDDFFQAGELYRRVLSEQDKTNLVSNIIGHLGAALKRIQYRQTALFYKADVEYGTRVAAGLNLNIDKVVELSNMNEEERAKATLNPME